MSLILVTTIFSQGFLFQEAYSGALETVEPDTTIDSAIDGNSIVIPDGGSTISDSMTFEFSGTDDFSGVASFECDVDNGGFSSCTSPLDLTSLSDGFHNFMVRAIDNDGNTDSTPASFSWTSSPVSEGDILVTDQDGVLFSVDPSGNRAIISDFGNAAQGALGFSPLGVAINASGEILVVDRNAGTGFLGALFSVDPSGNRTIISDFGDAAQGVLGFDPFGVAIFPAEPISEFGFGPSFPATGTNFLDEPDKPDLRLQEFSLASWFKTSHNAVGANAMIVNKGGLGAGSDMNYGMYLDWGERLKAGFESTTGANKFVTSPNSYDNGNAQYAIVTYDLSIIKLYVNGSMVASLSTTAIPDDSSSRPVRVGANSAAEDEFFNGSIDEVRIWNRALTDQEVSDQYNSAIFNTAGQVLYLDMS